MIYTETPEQATHVAERALAEMMSEGVPPNPQNYAIWFEYLTGRNPALVRYIDRVREKKLRLTAERHRDMFERFFALGVEGSAPEGWTEQIEVAAGRIVEALTAAGKGTEKYGAALATYSGSLNTAESKADIGAVITGILKETKLMDGEIRTLQTQIEDSQAEVTELRHQLAVSQQEAITDRLTGLTNRRGFDQALGEMVEEARVEREPLCLVLADIDHFKRFNDAHGHLTGDQVLRLLANTLTESIKGRDTAARYGGEEFAVILPFTGLSNAVSLADHIRERLATKKIVNRRTGERLGSITLSIGAAEYVPGEPVSQLITRADAALYVAKREGRNRVMSEAGLKDTELTLSQ